MTSTQHIVDEPLFVPTWTVDPQSLKNSLLSSTAAISQLGCSLMRLRTRTSTNFLNCKGTDLGASRHHGRTEERSTTFAIYIQNYTPCTPYSEPFQDPKICEACCASVGLPDGQDNILGICLATAMSDDDTMVVLVTLQVPAPKTAGKRRG